MNGTRLWPMKRRVGWLSKMNVWHRYVPDMEFGPDAPEIDAPTEVTATVQRGGIYVLLDNQKLRRRRDVT